MQPAKFISIRLHTFESQINFIEMNLVVDAGNTRLKMACFESNRQLKTLTTRIGEVKRIKSFLKDFKHVDGIIISSVINNTGDLKKILRLKSKNIVTLSSKLRMPLHIKYRTPKTLGNDRIANAAAGIFLFPDKATLVIDAGTCLKFDFTDSKKNYLGGAISCGLEMRYKALNYYTSKLPLLKPFEAEVPLIGETTQESIISGVQNGMINEIAGVIVKYKKKYKSVKVILTGGDWPFFVNNIKSPIFVAPNLTLLGLNEILNYHVKNA